MANYDRVRQSIKGLNIVSGALHPECIYLIAEEQYNPKKHGVGYDEWSFVGDFRIYLYKPLIKETGNEWQGKAYKNMRKMRKVAIVPQNNLGFCGVLYNGDTISQVTPQKDVESIKWIENAINNLGNRAITDVAVINDEVYASAGGGAVYKRITDNNWQEIALHTTEKFFSDKNFATGFNCIAGFSKDEIYLGGRNGTLWICDSNNWRPIELPVNEHIEQIVCASNDFVYIKSTRNILKGRKDKWEIIKNNIFDNSILRRISWFKNELYILPSLASAAGLYAMGSDNKIRQVSVGSIRYNPNKVIDGNPLFGLESKNDNDNVFIPSGMNDMVVSDELLMITGNDKVILFNGERWFNLFDKNRSEEELRATGTFYDPREL
ncbi:MAG: hypothetical protein KGV46_00140 [Pasteurella sp.]|nr:hypothetical protein [Pasteurella sp.]